MVWLALVACKPGGDGPGGDVALPWTEGVATDALWDKERIPTFRLQFGDPNWRDVLWGLVTADECADRAYLQAALVFENPMTGASEDWPDVGIRYRGHSALSDVDPEDRVGFKISFDEFVDARRFQDLKKVNLMGTEGDATLMREVLAFEILEAAGVRAPRTNYAHVYADDEFLGVFPLTEESDDEPFLEHHFDDEDGSLYRVGGYCGGRGDFEYEGDDPLDYAETYEPRVKTEVADILVDLVPLLHCTAEFSDDAFLACVEPLIDEASFFRLAAADVLFPDVDGMIGNGQNFMMYLDPTIDRLVFYAWDKDQAFATYNLAEDSSLYRAYPPWGDDFSSALGDRLIALKGQTYCDTVLDVAQLVDPAFFVPRIEALAAGLGPHVEADPFLDFETWGYGVDDIVELVEDRTATITALAEACAPPA